MEKKLDSDGWALVAWAKGGSYKYRVVTDSDLLYAHDSCACRVKPSGSGFDKTSAASSDSYLTDDDSESADESSMLHHPGLRILKGSCAGKCCSCQSQCAGGSGKVVCAGLGWSVLRCIALRK